MNRAEGCLRLDSATCVPAPLTRFHSANTRYSLYYQIETSKSEAMTILTPIPPQSDAISKSKSERQTQ